MMMMMMMHVVGRLVFAVGLALLAHAGYSAVERESRDTTRHDTTRTEGDAPLDMDAGYG
jgi:hypothetical protein